MTRNAFQEDVVGKFQEGSEECIAKKEKGEAVMDNIFTNDDSAIVSSNRILYTPSPFARASLFHLQEIGTLTALKPHISSHDDLASFLFFAVLDGEGKVTYKHKTYHISAGECVFIDCHKPFSHETSIANFWTLQWCHFFGPSLSLIYDKYLERGGRAVFKPNDISQFSKVLDSIFQIASSNDYIRDMRINERLSALLTLLMAESWHKKEQDRKAQSKQSVMPVKEYLDNHYSEKITLDDLSREFYISKNYLTRVFKEQFGMSIKEYLQVVRITHAKQLLRTTNKTAEEIGIECGFGALYYFSRVFKDIEGVSPTFYREKW
ncbi:AraC family transcriptional regulator [Roseburia hominis]